MNKLLLILLIVIFPLAEAHVQKAEYKNGPDTYSIQAIPKWITSPGTFNDLRIDYTVKKNGKTLHSFPNQGGVLLSCSYGQINHDSNLPKDLFQLIEVEGKPVGWWVKGFSVCGNTTSLRVHLVLPDLKEGKYGYFEISPKVLPKVTKEKNDYDFWFIYQEWGNAGTAGSFFVPRRIHYNSEWRSFKSQSIGTDPKLWPDFTNDFDFKNFQSLFVSGVLDRDPEVMKLAVNNYFKSDDESKQLYEWIGLPSTKEKASKEVEAMTVLKSTLEEFNTSKRAEFF